MKEDSSFEEVQFCEQPYQPKQVEAVKGNDLSFESQIVITTLIAINAALLFFLVFMIG